MMRLYLDCFIVSLCLLDIYHVANLNSTPCEIFRDGCVTEGCQYGVLDRFNENGEAIILLESVGQEVHIGHSNLPSGSKEGMWFRVTRDKKDYHLMIDAQKTWLEERRVAFLNYLLRQKKVQHSPR